MPAASLIDESGIYMLRALELLIHAHHVIVLDGYMDLM